MSWKIEEKLNIHHLFTFQLYDTRLYTVHVKIHNYDIYLNAHSNKDNKYTFHNQIKTYLETKDILKHSFIHSTRWTHLFTSRNVFIF